MSDEAAKHEFVAKRVMERLSDFIRGIGMSIPDAQEIVNRAVAEDPSAPEYDIEAKARLDADRACLANWLAHPMKGWRGERSAEDRRRGRKPETRTRAGRD